MGALRSSLDFRFSVTVTIEEKVCTSVYKGIQRCTALGKLGDQTVPINTAGEPGELAALMI